MLLEFSTLPIMFSKPLIPKESYMINIEVAFVLTVYTCIILYRLHILLTFNVAINHLIVHLYCIMFILFFCFMHSYVFCL